MIPMEDVGVRIQTIGPDDGTRLLVEARLTEVGGIAEWFGQCTAEVVREVSLGHSAVVECEAKPVTVERFDRGDA
jgi:hypothetical protein